MNSRERVRAALSHREPDKVPLDFGGMGSTGIMAGAYGELRKYLGLKEGRIRVYDFGQQLAEPEPDILERFGVDVVDLFNTAVYPDNRGWAPWTLPDGQPAERPAKLLLDEDGAGGFVLKDATGQPIARMPKGCLYFDGVQPPLGEPPKSLDEYNIPILTDEFLELIQTRAQWLHDNTDFAIMAGFGGNLLETGQGLRGWGNFMMDLAGDRRFAEDLLDKITETHLYNLRRFLDAVGENIDLIQMGDDLGTQHATQVSPEMYHDLFYPRHKQIYRYIRENSSVAVFLHSCGSLTPLIPDLIDAGVQALNPVQTSAADMDPILLKRNFGDQLTFWGGGCDTQTVLPNGTPEEIDAHVRDRISIFAPGGGFVFCQIHNIQSGIPARNVVAMFESFSQCRSYPIGCGE
ncbi:MAG: uroporphyrinogen decarboxylase family protein [bacterium]